MTEIPRVCFMEDVCTHLRMSLRTLKRLRRAGAFPIKELPTLDKRPRWSGADVQAFLDGKRTVPTRGWKRSA